MREVQEDVVAALSSMDIAVLENRKHATSLRGGAASLVPSSLGLGEGSAGADAPLTQMDSSSGTHVYGAGTGSSEPEGMSGMHADSDEGRQSFDDRWHYHEDGGNQPSPARARKRVPVVSAVFQRRRAIWRRISYWTNLR